MNRKINNGIFYVVISLALVIGVVSVTNAAVSFKQLLAHELAPLIASKITSDLNLNEPADTQEPSFGALPGGDIYQPVTFYDTVGFGEGRNQYDTFTKVISFTDATTTPVFWKSKTDGWDDFYLTDLWIENTGKATTTTRICVSTTTDTAIARDAVAYLTDDAGTCTLMKTLGNAFGADGAAWNGSTATGTAFSIADYVGTDTEVANQKLPVLIASTTNIFVIATSSESSMANVTSYGITGTGNTFDGKIIIKGIISNR